MHHVVFAGNPGVGKSSMLNSLIGSVQFSSGVAIGSGKTRILHKFEQDEIIYCDTPGLNDISHRQKAAEEISNAISQAAALKLIFVITLESGRVRPADATTIDIVLKAVEDKGIDMSNKFSLIINKCSPSVMNTLADKDVMNYLLKTLVSGRPITNVICRPFDNAMLEEDDCICDDCSTVKAFVESAPYILKHGQVVTVDATDYSEQERRKEAELKALQAELRQRLNRYRLQNVAAIAITAAVTMLGGPAMTALGARGAAALLALL